jgi:hypothetical protein
VRPSVPLLLLTLCSAAHASADQTTCSSASECREMALAAQQRGDVEAFHDLAWRTVQTGPKNDPALMFLLARAQSVSGRASDSLVMLQRLAARGFDISEADTSEDFRRVRNLAAWTDWRGPGASASTAGTTATAAAPGADASGASAAAPAGTARSSPPDATISAAGAAPPTGKPASARSPETARKTASTAGAASKQTIDVNRDAPLALPTGIGRPQSMAYDAVSGRMILVDAEGATLKVLSELSGNAANLVSAGWSGPYRTTAVAIDSARGDLWVAAAATDASAPASSVVHRLQLVSGRLLYSVQPPAEAGHVTLAAIALAGSTVYVLDAAKGRVLELTAGAKTLRTRATLELDEPSSLAVSADATVLYAADAKGIVRLASGESRGHRLTAARGVELGGLRWIARTRAGLLAIQRRDDGSHAAVRIRLDAAGRRATRLDVIGDAASPVATLMGDVFYYVAPADGGGTAIERVKLP